MYLLYFQIAFGLFVVTGLLVEFSCKCITNTVKEYF